MVASDTFAEFLREQLAPLGSITMRRMFGKTGVFCKGVMFGTVTENTLYLRVDDENKEAFKEAEKPSAAQLREGRRHHRSLLLADPRAAVR
jgi:DNA transformation protein